MRILRDPSAHRKLFFSTHKECPLRSLAYFRKRSVHHGAANILSAFLPLHFSRSSKKPAERKVHSFYGIWKLKVFPHRRKLCNLAPMRILKFQLACKGIKQIPNPNIKGFSKHPERNPSFFPDNKLRIPPAHIHKKRVFEIAHSFANFKVRMAVVHPDKRLFIFQDRKS